MQTLLRELKSLLEHEADIYGRYLPLDAPGDAAGDDPSDAAAPTETDVDAPADAALASEKPRHASGKAATDEATTDEATTDEPTPSEPNSEPEPQAESEASPSSTPDDDMPNFDLFGNQVDPSEDPSLPPWERLEALIPEDAPYKDVETLDDLEAFVAETTLVPIDEERQNPVFGVGDPDADLLIIGEAPGRNEDEQGEPFVGRAGQLLDKILDAINLSRSEVYIANILKSRPPRNRDPKAEEIEAHLPVLYKQIALIRPKIILCVGKVAGNTILDRRSSLKSLRQKEHDLYGIPVMVTYHPAALLRNAQWKRPTWEDMKLVRTRYDELRGDE